MPECLIFHPINGPLHTESIASSRTKPALALVPSAPNSNTLINDQNEFLRMVKVHITSEDVSQAVQKVFSPTEICELPYQMQLSLVGMVRRRLEEPGNPPTLADLEGIKLLATEHLWHPALTKALREPQDSEEN